MTSSLYFDYAAATPMDPTVVASMMPYYSELFYNPSATYLAGRAVRHDVAAARQSISSWLGCRPVELVFTAGGTESDNMAIHGVMSKHPGANIVVSAIEHDAVLNAARQYDCRIAPVTPDGIVDVDALVALVDENTVLVSVMYANNEVGTIQPLSRIASALAPIRDQRTSERPLYFHTDACQATPYLDLHVSRLGVDMLTLNGSKMYGPKQVGALYVRAGIDLVPLIYGGGQERNVRSGTENVPGIIGLAAALDLVQQRRGEEVARLQTLQKLFYELLRTQATKAQITGSLKNRLPNNIHITIPGYDNERLMMQFDEAGVQLAVGSACSASSEEPSHVLMAMGLQEADARSSLRITMGVTTDEAAVRRVVELLASFLS